MTEKCEWCGRMSSMEEARLQRMREVFTDAELRLIDTTGVCCLTHIITDTELQAHRIEVPFPQATTLRAAFILTALGKAIPVSDAGRWIFKAGDVYIVDFDL